MKAKRPEHPENLSAPVAPFDRPAREPAEESESQPEGSPGDYVFKIVSADPKNAFDFEDVADK